MGKNTEIIFIRHGETDLNKAKVYFGHLDPDLNETGIEQLRKAKILFEKREKMPDVVFSSDLKRCSQSMEILEIDEEIEKNDKGYAVKITDNIYKGSDKYNDLFDIEISNEAYSTSNQINTYVEINGEKYGHIISPKTGYPGKNRQIGIVTESAFVGDIISTGLFNRTPEKFQEIMKTLSKEMKVEGYLIDDSGNINYSEKFLNYVEI